MACIEDDCSARAICGPCDAVMTHCAVHRRPSDVDAKNPLLCSWPGCDAPRLGARATNPGDARHCSIGSKRRRGAGRRPAGRRPAATERRPQMAHSSECS